MASVGLLLIDWGGGGVGGQRHFLCLLPEMVNQQSVNTGAHTTFISYEGMEFSTSHAHVSYIISSIVIHVLLSKLHLCLTG